MFRRRPSYLALTIAITIALTACATPYGGPGGCLVLGSGTCTVEKPQKP